MGWILVVLVFIVMVFVSMIAKSKVPNECPYKKESALFSPAELSFYSILEQVVGDDAKVFGKVRVADVLTPMNGLSRSDKQKAFNKIRAKHFDFILCNKKDLSVICAIELNDSSHRRKKRIERDEFLVRACRSANVPLVQITAKSSYSADEIGDLIASQVVNDKRKL